MQRETTTKEGRFLRDKMKNTISMKDLIRKFLLDDDWVASLRYVPAVIPVLALTLRIKYSLLKSTATLIVSHNLGRYGDNALSFWEKLTFFRSDLFLGLILFPICYLFIIRILPGRYRALFAAALNISLFFMLYATWQCYLQTGQYYSSSTLRDSLYWGWHHPEFIGQYVSKSGIAQISLAIIFICVEVLWAVLRNKRVAAPHNEKRWRYGIVGYLMIVVLITLAPSIASSIPATQYHKSILIVATDSLLGIRDVGNFSKVYSRMDSWELIRNYRDLVHAPVYEKNPRYWGKAEGYNVLYFILETAPARVLRLDGDLTDLPVLQRLRKQAFIGLEHYTTYPYTNRAWFSIFSSLYPSSLDDNYSDKPGRYFPSLIHDLSDEGYITKVYYTPNVTDAATFQSLGFQQQYLQKRMIPQELPRDTKEIASESVQKVRIAEDLATLRILEKDMKQWLRQDQQFCVAIGPQIGHAPWLRLQGAANQDDLVARGHETIKLQDKWLGELVDILQKYDQLDKTIIVVVGDHGVRTRQEDPSFEGGMIDEYSFHVPLLIYVPGVLHSTVEIPWVTSHIDVSPTISDLLGITAERRMEQGSPIWEKQMQNRVTYFFANSYLGADGYTYEGQYNMKNQVLNTIYNNGTMKFSLNNLVSDKTYTYKRINNAIQQMVDLQEVLGKKAGEPRP
jgi:phosphoglycerol transferase MdoB-like AlkP superfamily enzyme